MRISDWSSDVCSSDLVALRLGLAVALEQQQRIVGIGADCRQRLVELVAERRRHLAERGELAGLHQIVLRAPEVGSALRSEEHTSELQSLMRISYAVFCLKKKKHKTHNATEHILKLCTRTDTNENSQHFTICIEDYS